jgi:hypothetical protein
MPLAGTKGIVLPCGAPDRALITKGLPTMITRNKAQDQRSHLLLDAALAYAARGWRVFPCHTPTTTGCSCHKKDCKDIGKHPRTYHGLKDATTDEATIQRWWKMWPQANIGIATGTGSGLVVLDHDSYKEGGDTSLEELEQSYSALPGTVQQLTGGGGVQYFFQHPGTRVKNGVQTLGAGLDIRGDGGYVIVPPSLHVSGKRYIWEVVHEPEDTPLASMPEWLLALCQDARHSERVDAGAPLLDGQRNDSLFRLGCSFRSRGGSEAVILAALREMNATQCQPPLADEEVQTIVGSIAKYEAGEIAQNLYKYRNGDTPGPEPSDAYACPELPATAKVDEERAAEASIFLDDYIAFSHRWAPRAFTGFHEGAALFALSTTAAHRVKIQLGPRGVYTSLYMAFAARTSLYTKSTCVDIGVTGVIEGKFTVSCN